MNFVECSVSELDLFSEEKLQASILNRSEVAYHPINSVEDASSIEFLSPGASASYRDLSNIFLKVKVQILKDGQTPFKQPVGSGTGDAIDTQPALVANSLHSLFKSITVQLNGTTVSTHEFYPYKHYLELITNYSAAAISSNFYTAGSFLDDEGLHDLASNTAHIKRRSFTLDGKTWTLYGRLSLDLSNQPKLLINNIDLRITLHLASNEFALFSPTSNGTFKIKEAELYLTHCHVNPNLMLLHNQFLTKRNIQYQFLRTTIKCITIPSKIQSFTLENLFSGPLPSFLILTFIENSSFVGQYKKSPFNLKKMGIRSLQLMKNSELIPHEPLMFDSEDDARPYTLLLDQLDILNRDKAACITKSKYDNGYFLAAFNLSPLAQIENCRNINHDGTLRVNIQFDTNLENSVTVLVYAMLPDVLEVDKNFNVHSRLQ